MTEMYKKIEYLGVDEVNNVDLLTNLGFK